MILILVLLLTFSWASTLFAQANFYQGKTIVILVGTKAGDVYDLYPRLLSEFWPKHIAGNPNIIIQNVPGAGSLIAANQAYNIAKPDGLTLGAIYPALYFNQLIKKAEVKYDWAKFNWIGSAVTSNQLLYMRADTLYKSIEEVRKAATAPKCGATDISSAGYYIPKIIDETLGTRFDIVSGYTSGQDIDLAVERDGRIKDSPTIYELMDKYKTDDAGRRLAKVILASGDFGRPIVAAPGVPADRMKIIRDAFNKAIHDPALLADAEKRRLDIDPATGEELDALAKEVMTAPADVVERVKKLIGM